MAKRKKYILRNVFLLYKSKFFTVIETHLIVEKQSTTTLLLKTVVIRFSFAFG